MNGTKHFNFDEEAMIIANNIMISNGVELYDNDETDIYAELEAYNCEREKLGLKLATLKEYCDAAGYCIEDFVDTSYNNADILEDYVEGEESIDEDSDEWHTGDEQDVDDWNEEDYENASIFDEMG